MTGPNIGYESGELRRGSEHHDRARTACASIIKTLNGIGLSAAMFGDVPAAAGFHGAAAQVRTGQALASDVEAGRRQDLIARSAETAALGDGLVLDTTALARSASSVSAAAPPTAGDPR
jgi:hypothetical protein